MSEQDDSLNRAIGRLVLKANGIRREIEADESAIQKKRDSITEIEAEIDQLCPM